MAEVRISIPMELHKTLKQKALDEGLTLKGLLIKILENYVGHEEERKQPTR